MILSLFHFCKSGCLSEDVQILKRELTAKEEELAKSLKVKEGNIDNITGIYNINSVYIVATIIIN